MPEIKKTSLGAPPLQFQYAAFGGETTTQIVRKMIRISIRMGQFVT